MLDPFRPDIFSVRGPGWVVADHALAKEVEAVLESTGDESLRLLAPPEQSRGLEINSNNLRIETARGRLLLKRWSAAADPDATRRTLGMMEWLRSAGMPVPQPVRLANGDFMLEHAARRWSVFGFVEGRWFSGAAGELESSAEITGKLTAALAKLPVSLQPGPGPAHLLDADDAVFSGMDAARGRWGEMLGAEHAAMLGACWSQLMADWRRLRDDPPAAGPRQAVHFDLHPHNMLVDDGRVVAVLDFEACQVIPVGYALAFAGLKQGRQAVAAANDMAASDVGSLFLRRVRAAFPPMADVTRVADLALAETLRRLAIIIRLNLHEGVATWNRVLPVQLAHLGESRLLFS